MIVALVRELELSETPDPEIDVVEAGPAGILGAILGGTMIGVKLFRARYNLEPTPDSESLRITPQG